MGISKYATITCTCDYQGCSNIINISIEKEIHFNEKNWRIQSIGALLQNNGWFSGKNMPVYCQMHTEEMVNDFHTKQSLGLKSWIKE